MNLQKKKFIQSQVIKVIVIFLLNIPFFADFKEIIEGILGKTIYSFVDHDLSVYK